MENAGFVGIQDQIGRKEYAFKYSCIIVEVTTEYWHKFMKNWGFIPTHDPFLPAIPSLSLSLYPLSCHSPVAL